MSEKPKEIWPPYGPRLAWEAMNNPAPSELSPARGSADWRPITKDEPSLGHICWLWDGRNIWIGGRDMVDSEYWLWGNCYNSIWYNGDKWDGDIETDDDYQPTNWMPLPNPPNAQRSGADDHEQ